MDRRYFEIYLFTQVVNELKSGDLRIPGSEEYGDYRDQLVSWEEYNRDVASYAEQAGVPIDPAAFVTALRARLARTANATDSVFPENEQVEIVDGEPVVKQLRAREASEPRRVCRRFQLLRGWSNNDEEDGEELLAGGARAGGPPCAGRGRRTPDAMGCDHLGCVQDWLHVGDAAQLGAPGRA